MMIHLSVIKQQINISALFLSALMFISFDSVYSQTDFIRDYAFFSIKSDFTYYQKGQTDYGVNDSPVLLTYDAFPAYNLGIMLNVYQYKRFIFQTGYVHKNFFEVRTINFKKGQTVYDFDFITSDFFDFEYHTLSIPLKVEYFFYKRFYIFSEFSYGFIYTDSGTSFDGFSGISIYHKRDGKYGKSHIESEVGVGKYFQTKYFLLETYIYYNKSFNNMWDSTLHIEGVKNRPYTEINGTVKQSGNYFGFGVNIFPVKFWKRKKTATNTLYKQ